jgi:phosphoglycerate dehydrogenase-like enzyme
VREQEPPGPDDVLRGHRSVLLTPHIAGLTAEAQERIERLVVGDVLRVLDCERAIGAV